MNILYAFPNHRVVETVSYSVSHTPSYVRGALSTVEFIRKKNSIPPIKGFSIPFERRWTEWNFLWMRPFVSYIRTAGSTPNDRFRYLYLTNILGAWELLCTLFLLMQLKQRLKYLIAAVSITAHILVLLPIPQPVTIHIYERIFMSRGSAISDFFAYL